MGLGGRREKQVIAADPRNTKWSNDKSNPGHKLLSSMGWKPDAEADEEEKKSGLMAHASSRRLRVIPIPKAGTEGIGYKPNAAAVTSGMGALPSSGGGTMSSAASSVFSRLGSKAALQFVSAGASKEVINKAKTEGGEFAGLLQRLNAANSAGNSASTTPTLTEDESAEEQKEETKEERRERRKRRKLDKENKREKKRAKKEAGAAVSATLLPTPAASISSSDENSAAASLASPPIAAVHPALFNPRMAARARHLASKRLLHASADAMAEILGLAPTPSPSSSTPASPFFRPSSAASLPPTLPPSKAASPAPLPVPEITAEITSVVLDEDAAARKKAEKKAAKKALKAALEGQVAIVEDAAGTGLGGTEKMGKKKRKREA